MKICQNDYHRCRRRRHHYHRRLTLHLTSSQKLWKAPVRQNHAARIGYGVGQRQQSAWQLRPSLHWLPVRARSDFKLATLSYKSRMTGQPDYLAAELRCYQPQLSLRSSSQELLTVAQCIKKLGRHCFSVAAPRVSNSLPLGLKTNCDSMCGFKTGFLKTFIPPGL